MAMTDRGTARLVALVLSTVLIQLLVAALLKETALRRPGLLWLGLAVIAATALNGIRFLAWGYAHRKYPLSQSYPLTALFFPCVMLLGAWYGEPVGARQIAAVGIIMAGLVLIHWGRSDG